MPAAPTPEEIALAEEIVANGAPVDTAPAEPLQPQIRANDKFKVEVTDRGVAEVTIVGWVGGPNITFPATDLAALSDVLKLVV
jgi:hypothetical protein